MRRPRRPPMPRMKGMPTVMQKPPSGKSSGIGEMFAALILQPIGWLINKITSR